MHRLLTIIALAVCFARPATRALAEPTAAPGPTVASAQPTPPWWIGMELHLSLLNNTVDQSTINLAFGYAFKAGHRWKSDWGAYFQVEQDLWAETEIDTVTQQGVLNIGLGAERLYFARRMRAALGVGPSILLFETALDERGTTGLYVDLRPTGIRWPVADGFVLVLDPLTFTIEMPALGGIPLVQIQYRTLFGIEYGLQR